MAFLKRLLRALPLLLLSPFLLAASFVALVIAQLLRTRRPLAASKAPRTNAASVVIPNWNGRDLLEKYLPSVVAALAADPANEIVVVDNGSTDGSADYLRAHFPQVTVVALPQNLGFGGGSNEGFRAAKNEVVVLLNSDMRVASDFLAPLLEGFRDPLVFAVSCQIFFTVPAKLREETGLTQAWLAGRRSAGPPSRRPRDPGSLPLLLRRRRKLRIRPPQVSGAGRLRPAAGALLPGRHRPWLHGVEARMEGAISAA